MKRSHFYIRNFIAILVMLPFAALSQTLPMPTLTVVPSCLYPGAVETLAVAPVTGATYYLFETDSGAINVVLFDGIISPLIKSTPTVSLTGVLAATSYQISITAISACCTSAAKTVIIPGVGAMIEFAAGNPLYATPNSIHQFSVQNTYPCLLSVIYIWEVTGNITFPNGTQQMTTSTPNANLIFGNTFGSGTLCVKSVSGFGVQSPVICTGIYHPGYTPD